MSCHKIIESVNECNRVCKSWIKYGTLNRRIQAYSSIVVVLVVAAAVVGCCTSLVWQVHFTTVCSGSSTAFAHELMPRLIFRESSRGSPTCHEWNEMPDAKNLHINWMHPCAKKYY